jgi:hypothetical protein
VGIGEAKQLRWVFYLRLTLFWGYFHKSCGVNSGNNGGMNFLEFFAGRSEAGRIPKNL